MQNNRLIQDWLDFADMDFQTAKYLYANMRPRPFEIICYHCQQAIEKLLKAGLIVKGVSVRRTHDLGLLAELLQEYIDIGEEYLEICDNLTPYGVRIRYPQELSIEEYHVKKALEETEKLYFWLKTIIEHI